MANLWGPAFLFILGWSILLNGIHCIVFFRRRRLRSSGFFMLLTALALVDVIIGGIWTGMSGVAAILDVKLTGQICHAQSFCLTFTQTMTAFLLATVALERVLRMVKPSRHKRVFVPKVTIFAILGLMVFCSVISSIHLYGHISTSWHSDEHQCSADFTESIRLLDMTFCFDHAIPYYVIALPAFVAAFIKVFWARRSPSKYGEIILEKNTYAPSDSYSSRLYKLQSKFGGASKKKSNGGSLKPTLGQRSYSSQGYTEAEHWDSDIDDGVGDDADKDSRQRVHSLPRPQYCMLIMAAVVTLVTALLWLPWIIARYQWSKTPRDPVPEGLAVLAILCMHSAAFVKPLLYFATNPFYRSAASKTFCVRKKNREMLVPPKQDPKEEQDNLGYLE